MFSLFGNKSRKCGCVNRTVVCECVGHGHPDKLADQISDAILDTYLELDPNSRVGIETLVKDNVIVVGGEVHSKANPDICQAIRNVIDEVHYPENHHLMPDTVKIINLIGQQSEEIHSSVDKEDGEIGAGDQGFVVGFASNETKAYLPLGDFAAKRICYFLGDWRNEEKWGPDYKTQVIVDYDKKGNPTIRQILISVMHNHEYTDNMEKLREEITEVVKRVFDFYEDLIPHKDEYELVINPSGSWEIGGPISDCGVTGRKIVVDNYGGYCNVGGGAFSGKDLTKVDRSGAYLARYIAKNIVAAGIANTAKVELSYIIGKPQPSSINIDLDENCKLVPKIKEWLLENVDMCPSALIQRFNNGERGIGHDTDKHLGLGFYVTARYGHFAPADYVYTWEGTELAEKMKEAILG